MTRGAAAALAVAAAFLVCAARDLRAPAPGYLEAMHVIPALRLLQGRDLHRDLWTSASVGGRGVFLTLNEYSSGWLETYLQWPLFAAAGAGVARWRWLALLVSLCAWLVWARLARELFGTRAALLALVLLCFHATLFFYARTGLDSESCGLWLLSALFWLCAARWQATGRDAWACAGAFALGLGLWEKLEFLWIAAAFALAYAAVYARSPERRAPPARAALFLLAGASPLVVANVVRPWCTVRFVWDGLRHPVKGTGNLDFAAHLLTRLRQFGAAAFTADRLDQPLAAPARLAKAIPLAACAAALAPRAARRLPRFAFVVGASVPAYLAAACVHGTGLQSYHVLVALPPFLVFAAGALDRLLPSRPLLVLAAALALWPDRSAWARYASALERTGGGGDASLALYDLGDACVRRGVLAPVSLRGAAIDSLEAVSGGRIVPRDAGRLEGDWESWLRDPGTRYVLPDPAAFAAPPYIRRDFQRWAEERGWSFVPEETFPDRAGRAVYSLCVLKRSR